MCHGSSSVLRPVVTPHVKQRSVEFPELFGTWRPRNTALTNEQGVGVRGGVFNNQEPLGISVNALLVL